MNIQLLIENELVDLTENIQFPMNLTFTDLADPSSIKTEWSKTITIPFTENNNRIFGNIFKLEKIISKDSSDTNIGYNFNPNAVINYVLLYNSEIINEGTVKFNCITKNGYEVNLFSNLYKYLNYLKNIEFGKFYFSLEDGSVTSKYLTKQEISDAIQNNKIIKEHFMWNDFKYKSKNINGGIVDVKGSDVHDNYNPKKFIRFITPWSGDIEKLDTANLIYQDENKPLKLNTKVYNNDLINSSTTPFPMLSINNLIPALKFETILLMIGDYTGLNKDSIEYPGYEQYGGLFIDNNIYNTPYYNKLLLTLPLYKGLDELVNSFGSQKSDTQDWHSKRGDYIENYVKINVTGSILTIDKSDFENKYIPESINQILSLSAPVSTIEVDVRTPEVGDTFMLNLHNHNGVITGFSDQTLLFWAPFELLKTNCVIELWTFEELNQPRKVASKPIFTEQFNKYAQKGDHSKGGIDLSAIPSENKTFGTNKVSIKLLENNIVEKVKFENVSPGDYFIKLNLNIAYKPSTISDDWVETAAPYNNLQNAQNVYSDMITYFQTGQTERYDVANLRKGEAYLHNAYVSHGSSTTFSTSMLEPEFFINPNKTAKNEAGIGINIYNDPNLNAFTKGLGGKTLFDVFVNYCKMLNLKIEYKDNRLFISTLNALFKDAGDTTKYIDITNKIDFSSKKIAYNNKYKYLNFTFEKNDSTLDVNYTENTGLLWGSKRIIRQLVGSESTDIVKSIFNVPIISNKNIRVFDVDFSKDGEWILNFNRSEPTTINLPDYTAIDGDSLKFKYKPLGIIFENDPKNTSGGFRDGKYVLEDNLTIEDEKQKYSYKTILGNSVVPIGSFNITSPLQVNSRYENYSCLFSKPSADYTFKDTNSYEPKTIFDRCWASTIDELYDINTRTMDVNVDFSLTDYKNFKWSNIYIINNTLWRINKIIDYNIGTKGLTKIQFISIQNINNLIKNQDL